MQYSRFQKHTYIYIKKKLYADFPVILLNFHWISGTCLLNKLKTQGSLVEKQIKVIENVGWKHKYIELNEVSQLK